MTHDVCDALTKSEVLIGYKTYLDLIPDFIGGKEIIASQMMKEVERCRKALELAEQGKTVTLVSGGDPGIYGMAGLILEMKNERGYGCDVIVLPGLAAVNSCAARLGAPLMHDFATVSLSDLLTPWDVIEKRLAAAAQGDFVTAIYNPKSKKRTTQIVRAREIFLQHRNPETIVGIVTAATRSNENIELTDLENMLNFEITMQTTVIIGNSQTYVAGGVMITPRGYREKYQLSG